MAAVVSADATAALTQNNFKIRFMSISFLMPARPPHHRAEEHEPSTPALIGGRLSWPSALTYRATDLLLFGRNEEQDKVRGQIRTRRA
jgi:hypothetical protein